MYGVMAMLEPKIDSRALVIKLYTAQVWVYGLGVFFTTSIATLQHFKS